MPKIVFTPKQHDCRTELTVLGVPGGERLPVGTVAECDCGLQWKVSSDQRDGPLWQPYALVERPVTVYRG